MKMECVHGSAVDLNGQGILILGNSGAGKSSLALELIDRGAILISDDQTQLIPDKAEVTLSPPLQIQGKMEVRGIGIVTFPYHKVSPLKLCVELTQNNLVERLPEEESVMYYDKVFPCVRLSSGDPLKALKVELKLCQVSQIYAA